MAHPQANGQVKRANRSIAEGIKVRFNFQNNNDIYRFCVGTSVLIYYFLLILYNMLLKGLA